jgi:hypothetical protein
VVSVYVSAETVAVPVTGVAPVPCVTVNVHTVWPGSAAVSDAVGPLPLDGATAPAGEHAHVQSPGAVSTVSPALSSADPVSVTGAPPVNTVAGDGLTETDVTVPTIVIVTD